MDPSNGCFTGHFTCLQPANYSQVYTLLLTGGCLWCKLCQLYTCWMGTYQLSNLHDVQADMNINHMICTWIGGLPNTSLEVCCCRCCCYCCFWRHSATITAPILQLLIAKHLSLNLNLNLSLGGRCKVYSGVCSLSQPDEQSASTATHGLVTLWQRWYTVASNESENGDWDWAYHMCPKETAVVSVTSYST